MGSGAEGVKTGDEVIGFTDRRASHAEYVVVEAQNLTPEPDVIRFAEIYHEVRFTQALVLLRQWRGLPPLLRDAANFYRLQLRRHCTAVAYLDQRGIRSPEVIDHMRIGYTPGACLRRWLMELGHPLTALSQAGLVTSAAIDSKVHRIVFPLEGNLYGCSISASAPPHRFLPASKGGLYRWDEVRRHREVILVEGLFDYAVLWQAGFHNVTCSLGTQPTPVKAAVRLQSNHLSGLRWRSKRYWPTRSPDPGRPTARARL
jgi:hypothetical protein